MTNTHSSQPVRASGDVWATYARRASVVLARGEVIAYPTDTLYGLGVDATRPHSLRQVVRCKRRDPRKPFLVMVRDLAMACEHAHLPSPALLLARTFWPGPLSLVVPVRPESPLAAVANNGFVGIRVPAHPFCQTFFEWWHTPVTTTSANRSGARPLNDPEEIAREFGADVALIVPPGGAPPRGVASTVVACAADGSVTIVREGAIPRDHIASTVSMPVSTILPEL